MARIDPGSADHDPDPEFEQTGDGDPLLIRPYIINPAAIPSTATGPGFDNANPIDSPRVPRQRTPDVVSSRAPADEKPLYGRSPEADLLRRRHRRPFAAALTGAPAVASDSGDSATSEAASAGLLAVLWPPGRRRRPLLIGAGAVAALVLIFGVGSLVLRDGPTPGSARRPEALPPALGPPGEPSLDPTLGGVLPQPSSAVPGGAVPPGAGIPAPGDPAPGDPAPGDPAPGNPAPTATRPATVPPTEARTTPPAKPGTGVGPILGVGGRCLDVIGGVEARGHRVQVLTCNGSAGQTWSLTPGATLTAGDLCAQSTSSLAVKLVDCDGSTAGLWRVGTASSLVNTRTNLCLTDPSAGTGNGVEVTLAACVGGAGQRWALP